MRENNNDKSFIIFNNAKMYCDIALENFYCVEKLYEELIELKEFYEFSLDKVVDFDKKAAISIVFSQMCIESLLNVYATNFFKQEELSEIFDKLSVKEKLVFVSTVIFEKEIDKGTRLFDSISKLVKQRNRHIHDKPYFITHEEYEKIENNFDSKKDLKDDFLLVKNGIVSIVEVAKFLQNKKQGLYILEYLFLSELDDKNHRLKEKVIKEFRINFSTDL